MIPARHDDFGHGNLLPARMLSFRKTNGVVRMKYSEYWLQFGKEISLCDDELENGDRLWKYLEATNGGNIFDASSAIPTFLEPWMRRKRMLQQLDNVQDMFLYGPMVISVHAVNGGFDVRMGGLDRFEDRKCIMSRCLSSGSLDTVFLDVGIGQTLRKCVRNKSDSAVYNEEIRNFWRSDYFIHGESRPAVDQCITSYNLY